MSFGIVTNLWRWCRLSKILERWFTLTIYSDLSLKSYKTKRNTFWNEQNASSGCLALIRALNKPGTTLKGRLSEAKGVRFDMDPPTIWQSSSTFKKCVSWIFATLTCTDVRHESSRCLPCGTFNHECYNVLEETMESRIHYSNATDEVVDWEVDVSMWWMH